MEEEGGGRGVERVKVESCATSLNVPRRLWAY